MKNADARLVALFLAIGAAQTLGIPALSWSPLQNDSMKEVEQVPEENLREKFFQDLIKQQEAAEKAAAEAAAQAAPQSGKETGGGTSIDEDPNAKSKTDLTDESDDYKPATKPAREVTADDDKKTLFVSPSRPKQLPGKQPREKTLDPTYFFKKSQEFVKQEDYQSALNYVNRALELNPQYWEAWYQKALAYQLAGYDAAAARRYIKLIERKPDMLEAHIALGSLYRKHQNYDLAAKEYKAAIELKYYTFAAHYNLANVLMDQENLEQALKEYKICLKMQPDNAMVHNNMGVIYQHRNYLEEATEEFKTASHLDPANPAFIANLSNARKKIGGKPAKSPQM